MTTPQAIEYGISEPSNKDGMINLLPDVFPRGDPPAYTVGLIYGEFEAFVRLMCPFCSVREGWLLNSPPVHWRVRRRLASQSRSDD